MAGYTLNQFGWATKLEECKSKEESENSAKLKCLEKKQAAAIAAENVSFFIEECGSGISLINNSKEKANDITENTVKKHVNEMAKFSSTISGNISSLEGLVERLEKIETMYQKMAQNHEDNRGLCIVNKDVCSDCQQRAKDASYFDDVKQEQVYGTAYGFILENYKGEMDGVEKVE